MHGGTFSVYIQTASWRRTTAARSGDPGVENNNTKTNSGLHVASIARRGGSNRLSVLLFLLLTCCDTTRDWRRFSASLRAATRPLISLLSAFLAARRAAILHEAMPTATSHEFDYNELTARSLRRLFPPHQLRNTLVVDHWRAGQQHTAEEATPTHTTQHGVTPFACYVSHATHSFLVHFQLWRVPPSVRDVTAYREWTRWRAFLLKKKKKREVGREVVCSCCQKRRDNGKYTQTSISNAVFQVFARHSSVKEDVVQQNTRGGQ